MRQQQQLVVFMSMIDVMFYFFNPHIYTLFTGCLQVLQVYECHVSTPSPTGGLLCLVLETHFLVGQPRLLHLFPIRVFAHAMRIEMRLHADIKLLLHLSSTDLSQRPTSHDGGGDVEVRGTRTFHKFEISQGAGGCHGDLRSV